MLTREQVNTKLFSYGSESRGTKLSPLVANLFKKKVVQEGLDYLYTRHDFVMAKPQNLYWLVFWDDFWTLNLRMKLLRDLGAKGRLIFGSTMTDSESDLRQGEKTRGNLIYNPIPREELKTLLQSLDLWGDGHPDQKPQGFYTELLDKL